MPTTPSYPGVYVQDMPSASHALPGVTTAVAAFVGMFERGPVDKPVRLCNFREFTATFGAPNPECKASYGVYQFFLNGGAVAWVVRVGGAASSAAGQINDPATSLVAVGPGVWGNHLQAAAQPSQLPNAEKGWFDLVVREVEPASATNPQPNVQRSEVFTGLSSTPGDANYVGTVLKTQSTLVALQTVGASPSKQPPEIPLAKSITNPQNIADPASGLYPATFSAGTDDFTALATADEFGGQGSASTAPTGMYSLDEIAPEMFNILCIPGMASLSRSSWGSLFAEASNYCSTRLAFLIADQPTQVVVPTDTASEQISQMQEWFKTDVSNHADNAAVYFPRLEIDDPLGSEPFDSECSGTLAGMYASTDTARGVWKAPAGQQAVLRGVSQPAIKLTDSQNGELNQLGINCIRTFPVFGTVSWGARTTRGADMLQSEWKYIPVRRLALHIEASLRQGTRWAVFEPNDESLWASLRLSVGGFMNTLYRAGAFQGSGASEAYFVTCDASTTTPADQQAGIVNVLVGFAPMKPAEFVVLKIATETQTP